MLVCEHCSFAGRSERKDCSQCACTIFFGISVLTASSMMALHSCRCDEVVVQIDKSLFVHKAKVCTCSIINPYSD